MTYDDPVRPEPQRDVRRREMGHTDLRCPTEKLVDQYLKTQPASDAASLYLQRIRDMGERSWR